MTSKCSKCLRQLEEDEKFKTCPGCRAYSKAYNRRKAEDPAWYAAKIADNKRRWEQKKQNIYFISELRMKGREKYRIRKQTQTPEDIAKRRLQDKLRWIKRKQDPEFLKRKNQYDRERRARLKQNNWDGVVL